MRVWKRYKRLGTRSVGPHELTLILAPSSLRTADVSPRSSLLRDVSRGFSSQNVPQWRWARRNVCRSQATHPESPGDLSTRTMRTWSSSSGLQEVLRTRTAQSLPRWFFVRLENNNLLSCFIKRSLQWIHVLNCRRLPTASWTMVTTVRHSSWE